MSYEDLRDSVKWLQNIEIEPVPFGKRDSIDPFVSPNQGNASVYFNDPDGNSLELMCFVSVPENLKNISNKLSIEEWEDLLKR